MAKTHGAAHPSTPGNRPHGSGDNEPAGGRPRTHVVKAGSVADGEAAVADALDGGLVNTPSSRRSTAPSRPALLAAPVPKALAGGRSTKSLDDVRRARNGPSRGAQGEQLGREMFGAGPERHFPVTPNPNTPFPVTTPGGRKVDAPVDLPDGGVLAVEIKHYRDWKWVSTPGGGGHPAPNEVPLSPSIREQVNKDVALRNNDPTYDPRWVFLQAGPSNELREHLTKAAIIFVEYG